MNIERSHSTGRMSQIVKHNGTVYLAGQVGTLDETVAKQTKECLDQIDTLLAEAGASSSSILQAIIWLSDMSDFAEMNEIWDAWVRKDCAPARACGEAKLARPGFKVEIIVIAAYDT